MKLANALFALVVGVVLGVTAWAVSERSGGLVRDYGTVAEKAQELAARAEAESAQGASEEEKKSNRTERMIERGELSDHPARFWKSEGDKRR